MSLRSSAVLLAIILFFASFLRLEGVFTQSFAFTYDVGRDLLALQNILLTGKIPLIGQTTGLAGLFYGPWWYYSLLPAFVLSKGNPAGIAFFMALTGIITVWLGYILGVRIKDRTLGLLFASFLAVSPVMVGIATQIWNPNVSPLYMLLFFLCVSKIIYFLEKKETIAPFWLLGVGILLGLLLDSEIVFGTLFFAGAFLSFIFFFGKKLSIKQYLLLIGGIFFILSPRVIFEFRHNFIMTQSIFEFARSSLSQGGGSFFMHAANAFVFLEKLWNYTISLDNYLFGIGLLIGTTIGVLYFYKKISKREKFFLHFSLLTLFSFFVGLSLFPGDIWGHYTVGIPVLYIFILSLIFYNIIVNFKKAKIAILTGIVLLLLINLKPLERIKNINNPFWEGDISLYRNQIAVVDAVYAYAKGQKFNYIVYTPPIYDFTYKYLFSWYGNGKYGYPPSERTEKILFLIMEPDTQYPDRLKKWLDVRNGDGRTIDSKILKGDVQLQIRVR